MHQKSQCFSILSNEDTQHRRCKEEAATDPESESELAVQSSGEAVASKAKALRKAAAKRAARRQSAPEKPKVGGGGRKKENWHHFWKSHIVFIGFDSFVVFLLSYSVNSLRAELFVK